MMKKLLLMFFCLAAMQLVRAQSTYDFSAVNDDGLTLYYKVVDETKKEVSLAEDHVFYPYAGVTKIVIPDKVKKSDGTEYTVTEIGYTFTGANLLPSLKELTLPNTLKKLEWQPFLGIQWLKKFVLPAGVEETGGIVFQFSPSSTPSPMEIYLMGTTPPAKGAGYPVFNMDLTYVKIYVPIDCSTNYKAGQDWKMNAGGDYGPIPYLEQITLNANGYASLYLENENFEVPTGCTAYIVKGSKQGAGSYPDADLVAFAAGSLIPKQTAFILENLSEKGKTIGYHANISGTEVDVSDNLLVGTATGEEFSGAGYKYYIFSDGSLGQGFYHQGTRKGQSIKVKAHRAGLRLPVTGHGFAPAKELIFDFEAAKEQLATGIRQLPHVAPASKEDVIFDLQGRRVLHPTRGIYIINGKKVVKE